MKSYPSLQKMALICIFTFAINPFVQAQTILLSEDFSDNERSTQNLPSSSTWYSSSNLASLNAGSGALVRTGTNSALTYFTSSASPQILSVGDSLRFNFNISFAGSAPAAPANSFFRVGAYNSFATSSDTNASTTATRISADNLSNSNATYTDYSGYMIGVAFSPTAAGSARMYEKISNSTTTSLFSIGANMSAISPNGGTDLNFVIGNTYSATYLLTRTSTGIDVSLSYDGTFIDSGSNSVSATQSTSFSDTTPVYTFDTFAFHQGDGSITSTTLDNFVVTYTAIPEPSTYLMVLLAGGILAVARLRRTKV